MATEHNRRWYVITGGPSAGKTTLLHILGTRGYSVYPEVARLYIDEQLLLGVDIGKLRGSNERQFQDAVLERKVDFERTLDPSKLALLDRGMHDTIAYYQLLGFKLTQEQHTTIASARYQGVFLVELLPNVFEVDHARTETLEQARHIEELLHEAYSQAGYSVVRIPPTSVKERAEMVESMIATS